MEGGADRLVRRRKSLKERLSFKAINCCGASWGLVPATMSVRDDDEEEEVPPTEATEAGADSPPVCAAAADTPTGSGMNLAAALAAERQYRAVQDSEDAEAQSKIPAAAENTLPGTAPLRVSLMRLLEENDGETTATAATEKESRAAGSEAVCCVCMGRKKGAAFIPCGHTFCRVCSRELWLNRGSCPLCNRSILEILDIY